MQVTHKSDYADHSQNNMSQNSGTSLKKPKPLSGFANMQFVKADNESISRLPIDLDDDSEANDTIHDEFEDFEALDTIHPDP